MGDRNRASRGIQKKRVAARKPPRPAAEPSIVNHAPAPSLGDAPMTITLGQFRDLEGRATAAEARAATLEADLATARTEDRTGRVALMLAFIRGGLLPIVRFGIANLPPSEIPKWPFKAVEIAALGLPSLPDFSADDEIFVKELEAFANDIQEHELDRGRKRAELIANAPNEIPKAPPKMRVVQMATDGRCNCNAADPCPLGRTGSAERCLERELIEVGVTCVAPGTARH